MFEREATPDAEVFSQTIDVDLDLDDSETKAFPNMPGYLIRSETQAIRYTRSLVDMGIKSVTYRLGGGLRRSTTEGYVYAPLLINTSPSAISSANDDALILRHASFYKRLRSEFTHSSLHVIADPFGLAPNMADGAWGQRDQFGSLDFSKTGQLLASVAVEFAAAGVSAILTMGRLEYEVEISREALRAAGLQTEIYAFAQNNESKAAYIYLDKIRKKDSFQKILPGNLTEMKVRTVLDIYGGADVIVIKPADNFHVIQFTVDFISDPQKALSYLVATLATNFYANRQDIRARVSEVVANAKLFEVMAKRVRVGSYAVSGTYFIDKLLERDKGAAFLFDVEDERFRNILSIMGPHRAFIIDRSAEWYLASLKDLELSSRSDHRHATEELAQGKDLTDRATEG